MSSARLCARVRVRGWLKGCERKARLELRVLCLNVGGVGGLFGFGFI